MLEGGCGANRGKGVRANTSGEAAVAGTTEARRGAMAGEGNIGAWTTVAAVGCTAPCDAADCGVAGGGPRMVFLLLLSVDVDPGVPCMAKNMGNFVWMES